MVDLILEEEVNFDYFVLTQLYPLETLDIAESVARTTKLMIVEEGATSFGVGAELIARLHEAREMPEIQVRRVGAVEVPIPCSRHQERQVLPSKERILRGLIELRGVGII